MPNTTGVLDSIAITVLGQIGFSLSTSEVFASLSCYVPKGCGLILLAEGAALDDAMTVALNGYTSDEEFNDTSYAKYHMAYYANVSGPITPIVSSSGNGTSSGYFTAFLVQGAKGAASSISYEASSTVGISPQQPGANTVIAFNQGYAVSTFSGAGANSWRVASDNSYMGVWPNAVSGTLTFGGAGACFYLELIPKEKVRKQRFVTVREPVVAQPQGNVEIDWGNPINEKLFAAVIGDKFSYGPAQPAQTFSTACTRYGIAIADGYRESGTIWDDARNYFIMAGDVRTIVVLALLRYTSSSTTHFALNTGNFRNGAWQVGRSGAGWSTTFVNSSNTYAYISTHQPTGRREELSLYVCRVNGDGTVDQFVDGEFRQQDSVSLFSGAISEQPTLSLHGRAGEAEILYGLYLHRAMMNGEIADLYRNPFQIFKPRERSVHIPAPVVTHKRKRLL
jgi:hypothetical protein